MSARYFLSDDQPFLAEGRAILREGEARHLIRVMRARIGDEVLLFNGSGLEHRARVAKLGRNEAELEIIESRNADNEPEIEVTAAVALPKGDRQKWLIEKLTELGVRRFIPLAVEREDVKIDDSVLNRLRRQVIEASKQSGRSRLMEIFPKMTRRDIAATFPFSGDEESPPASDALAVLTHPISDGDFGQLSFMDFVRRFYDGSVFSVPKRILLAVGPVGGFTDAEVREAVDDGWPILDLGKEVYRVETAAITAAALFLHLGN